MDLKTKSEMDQTTTYLSDLYPVMWTKIYKGLLAEGFVESEAFELLKIYILSQGTNGVHFKWN